jgi:UDP-2,3-diacylglucosamine hydrolase
MAVSIMWLIYYSLATYQSHGNDPNIMQHTLFISDLHLSENQPDITQNFLKFLKNHASEAQAIYILGDFFDLWVGDDDDNCFNKEITTLLRSITEKTISINFIHGNRDFLIGETFAKQTGCKILNESTTIQLYGQTILILHGDALCTLDKRHMKFRKITQSTLLKSLFLLLPLTVRKKIGTKIRANSRMHHADHKLHHDVVQKSIEETLKLNGATRMIHGHIHKPGIYHFTFENHTAERIVLGSWDKHGCCLKWYSNGKREMCFF